MVKIGIVGGGISGLASALALTRTDHDVQLFERAPELKEVGSGLTLWSNATRVLRELGVLDRCLKSSQVIRTFCLRLAHGRTVMTIPIGPFATTAVAMHRADLQSALTEAVPKGKIHTNHTCCGVREEAGKTFLVFEELTPNLGQGACMALEDAIVLSKMLGTAEQSSSFSSVVAAYEAERFRRIEAMVRRCRWLGALGQWQRPPIAGHRNVLAAQLPGSFFHLH